MPMTSSFYCSRVYKQRFSILCLVTVIFWAICISIYHSLDSTTFLHRISRWSEVTWEKLHWTKDHSLFRGTHSVQPSTGSCTENAVCANLPGLQSLFNAGDKCQFSSTAAFAPHLGSLDILSTNNKSCLDRQHRFSPYQDSSIWQDLDFGTLQRQCSTKQPHSAILLKTWDGFTWSEDDIQNVRALFTETVLQSGGEYNLFILLHIRDPKDAIPKPDESLDDVKRRYVPLFLIGITEIWTYDDAKAAYPKVGRYEYFDHALMSTQLFATSNSQYSYFWNWEVDTRYTAHYGDLFTQSSLFAKSQPLPGISKRNTKFYIPTLDGSWETYINSTPSPSTLTTQHPKKHFPDDEAHLITFYPIFSTSSTHWRNSHRIYNYPPSTPRLGSIGLNARFSRPLLHLMAAENEAGRAMMAEMFAPTMAEREGLKMVFVPHAIFLSQQPVDGGWDAAEKVGRVFNSEAGVLDLQAPRKWSTWSWDARFAGEVYRRWMGKGEGGGEWEEREGRVCLPALLLHPVK